MKKNNKFKVGVFSGSFDPPHKGHIYIAKLFINKLKLDKLIWNVSIRNPLFKKNYFHSYKERVTLSKKICKNYKKIQINDYDKKYSYKLVESVKNNYKNSEIYFLIGLDNLKYFHKWKKFAKIIEYSTLVVINRPGYYKELVNSVFFKNYNKFLKKKLNDLRILPGKTWIFINDKGKKISSSSIKNRIYKINKLKI